ncbi:NADH-ubiquinone oxidoreductase B18 subunit (CI-B18) [Metschnikowia bicuspidata var. bicuspidata NRRL YB-4993]|uniref:NADH-ubiquinone oxidoreductase B18 subunit (CI-B18) n=1 Tax=Metschnikowia bicuspidata var. bicuspidata NRRL YB-4993 TaxID=869754 RepID=A0A1A0H4U5_9ASCO|nr:NADH-ubiquinone oxidoreductase B18 subunit (CI-B18) [Metschnikowia bicuspidata var. bicuspidata NRRL YB-4993]OBA18970.1 NADH-ubiquinone oxidoreductase B18 subunit (CI-B18) [Metschnikowia bicuspidata var. bicuspidata NRRL YB-4993]
MALTEFPPLLSEQDFQKYKVPLKWRDRCAAYFALFQTCLIRQSANSSIDCHHDKHIWEECEALDLSRRKQELKEVKEKLRSNDA